MQKIWTHSQISVSLNCTAVEPLGQGFPYLIQFYFKRVDVLVNVTIFRNSFQAFTVW